VAHNHPETEGENRVANTSVLPWEAPDAMNFVSARVITDDVDRLVEF
jgi:hypothetical protein